MNVPEHWLRSFVDPELSTDRLAHLLTMSGLEVESCEPVAPPLKGVVVGEIVAVERHPNADKLTVCTVSTGSATRKVVCGAPNARAGLKAPLALPGTTIGKIEIKVSALRGVESHGMLCSAKELGFSDDHSGLLELPADAKAGTDIGKALQLDEQIFTFKFTPNRADCLSVLGIAREVSALTGAKLNNLKIERIKERNKAKHLVKISNPEGCGRFAGRVIRNVNAAAPSPAWMRQRLERAGQRSISARSTCAGGARARGCCC
jgi:phenylalanyl-tRNA synthetase beta chain